MSAPASSGCERGVSGEGLQTLVDAIDPGTARSLSLLAPERAKSAWLRAHSFGVVLLAVPSTTSPAQRIAVKVELEQAHVLAVHDTVSRLRVQSDVQHCDWQSSVLLLHYVEWDLLLAVRVLTDGDAVIAYPWLIVLVTIERILVA